MKFSLSSLKEYLETNLGINQISDKLTAIGFEVESIEDSSQCLKDFTVAKIIEAKAHPDSKKLKICKVQTDDSKEPLQIICGAHNARENIKVAYAKIGSVIPANGMVIKKAKIAGVESNGMLCSSDELGIKVDDCGGIIEIDNKWPVGSNVAEVFGLNEIIIEINITPNRGDCLGIYQIARELSVAGAGKLKKPSIESKKGSYEFPIKVNNDAKDHAKSLHFRHFKNLKNIESPKFIKDRLRSCGINPKSALVDITNYVMVSFNRPMHAYDASKIDGGINVSLAKKEEKFTTLKNDQLILESSFLTIRDDLKPIAIAGIIGSLDSSCDLDTSEIILEAAYFMPDCVAATGRKLNIISDARHRFERGVDPTNCKMAIDFATNLINKICGGEYSEVFSIEERIEPIKIEFDLTKIKDITSVQVSNEIAKSILSDLGFEVKESKKNIVQVTVPAHRHDVGCYQDLIEEIVRIEGYNQITSLPFDLKNKPFEKSPLDNFRLYLTSNSYIEAINWSFLNSNQIKYFSDLDSSLFIDNPISSEIDYLRPNLILGLIENAKRNLVRSPSSISLFEIGNIFDSINLQADNTTIAGIRIGKIREDNHYLENRLFDVFDVKKDVLQLLKIYGLKETSFKYINDQVPKYYNPHRFSKITLGNKVIARFGEIHPSINKSLDLKPTINAFEIFINNLPKIAAKKNKAYIANNHQIIERDIAFIVESNVPASELVSCALQVNSQLIKDIIIFDIYRGDKIKDNKKSLALRLKIQPTEKSLTSKEITDLVNQVTDKITINYQAQLRDS